MAHCFISLKLAKRFEKGGQVKLEPICMKDKTKENQEQDTEKINKDQGLYFVQYMKLSEVYHGEIITKYIFDISTYFLFRMCE